MEAFAALSRELRAQGVQCAAAPARRLSAGAGVSGGAAASGHVAAASSGCWLWPAAPDALFVKVAGAASAPAFAAEAAGLAELAAARALRVPRVLACGCTDEHAFLAIEWLEAVPADALCEQRLGSGLAAMHAVSGARFGFCRDNTIGRTPQTNAWMDDWPTFYRERRLRPQLQLAVDNGYGRLLGARGERLLEALPELLAGHRPLASLLHGDLWGGNWLAVAGGEPVVFDPAVYYGDRETDVAMTRLFGGFGPAFYRAYEAAAPLAPGAERRTHLYNLYHVLNHANLFGAAYARQARGMIDALLAEVGA